MCVLDAIEGGTVSRLVHTESVYGTRLCDFGLDLARVAISSVHYGFELSMHMVLK